MNHKTTEELAHEIKISTNIKDYLTQNREQMQLQSLTDALHSLLNEKKNQPGRCRTRLSARPSLCLSDLFR